MSKIMNKELKRLQDALNKAVGNKIFIIEEDNKYIDDQLEYRITLKSIYSNMSLLTCQGIFKDYYIEKIKEDVLNMFTESLFKSLIYGLPLNNCEDILGRKLINITNLIIQELLLNYFRKEYSNRINPFKSFTILNEKLEQIDISIEYNKIICIKSISDYSVNCNREIKEFYAKSTYEVANVIEEVKNYIGWKN